MNIQQGTLPNDGDHVDPSTFLESWINGTTVWNLPPGAFKGGDINFVWSQTDEPDSSQKFLGMLWFKRGDGRLYMYDKPDLPFGYTFADQGWICLSDRRELWARSVAGNIPLGAPCMFLETKQSDAVGIVTNSNQQFDEDLQPRALWQVFTGSALSGYSALNEITFVAMETGLSGAILRVCELGPCLALAGSGESGNAGTMVLDEFKTGYWRRVDPTCGSACRFMPLAQAWDSSATAPAGEWLRPVYKHMAPLMGTSVKA